jgi:DNA replication protein DnaC
MWMGVSKMEKIIMFGGREFVVAEEAACEKHGAYARTVYHPLFGVWGYTECPVCKAEREVQKRFGSYEIPERYMDKTFDDFEVTSSNVKAYEFLKNYAEHPKEFIRKGTSVILFGGPGVGKTHLSCATAKAIANQGYSILFTTVSRMIRKVRETWNNWSYESELVVIERYADVDFLVLDEVCVLSGNEQQLVFDILNMRYERHHPTILISNGSLADIEKVIGTRCFDRLREGGGKAFYMEGRSKRK